MKYKAILLDMDGLMFDTEKLSNDLWLEVSKEEKCALLPQDLGMLRGKNKEGGKQAFLQRFGDDFPYDKLCDTVNGRIEAALKKQVPIKPGLIEFLEAAKEKNIPVAVASSSARSLVEQNLEVAGVKQFISAIAAGDEVENSKPEPDVFLLAAKRLGVSAHECIAFEDSPSGVRAANAAGCSTVMVPDCDKPTQELKRLTSFVVENLNDAIALI